MPHYKLAVLNVRMGHLRNLISPFSTDGGTVSRDYVANLYCGSDLNPHLKREMPGRLNLKLCDTNRRCPIICHDANDQKLCYDSLKSRQKGILSVIIYFCFWWSSELPTAVTLPLFPTFLSSHIFERCDRSYE